MRPGGIALVRLEESRVGMWPLVLTVLSRDSNTGYNNR